MAELQKQSLKFLCTGMAFGVVNDLPVKGKFNFLQNIRVFKEGVLEARPTLIPFIKFNRADTQEVPHSLKTISNQVDGSLRRIVGVGTKIFSEVFLSLLEIIDGVEYFVIYLNETDSGYSGKPLHIFDFRPEASIQAYAYIADENKFRKIGVDNTVSDVGITPPQKAATWQIGKPERKIVDAIEAGSEAAWNNLTGTAAAPTLETRIDTTVLAYLADAALPNFASIVPTVAIPDLQRGAIVKLNGAEEVIIDEVLPATLLAGVATISKITYDAGASGLATIVLSVPSSDIKRDSILKLVNATPTTEYVRVQEVTLDDKGIPSLRVSTVATFAVGNAVTGMDSFRFYTAVGYAVGNTIIGKYIKSAIGASGISSFTRTFNVDLTNTGTKALTLEDILHTSMAVSNASNITGIQIQLDVDSVSPFLENYYFYSISPNFLIGAVTQTTPTISIIQQVIQRRELISRLGRGRTIGYDISDFGGFDEETLFPESTLEETTLGQNQWTELEIPLKDFILVGADRSKTLKDIKAIRISVVATAAVDISIDSIWVGGSEALNSNSQGFLPYNYVWRIRDPATMEFSNWSPPLRTGIKISRGKVQLSFPDAVANYPASYKIDIARFGGSLSDFRILGTIKNDGSSYTDVSSDRLIADNDLAGRFEGNENAVFDYYKPFAVLDTPKLGTCDVLGTAFTWKTGDKLNISYPRGTQIVINGKVNRFYTNPTSSGAADAATKVELEFDMGVQTDVVFEIKDPLLTGQPLPVVWGSFGEGNFGNFFFGLGYKKAAGTLYWLDGNSPGTMSDLNNLEITSPSEPLVAGVMYDGLPYVWSIEKSFQIVPTYAGDQFSFVARENANSRGLFSRYAIVAARNYIYHLTENADGIVRVAGNGNPQYITEGIATLFYNNGNLPSETVLVDGTEIFPPNFLLVDDLRLFSIKDYMFFRFKDTQGKDRCLVFDERREDWISYDVYINDKINGIYFEELKNFSNTFAGVPDGVARFTEGGIYEENQLVKVVPFSLDAGDSNLVKEFKEVVLSVDEGTLGLTLRNYYDNGDEDDPVVNIAGSVTHERKKIITNLQDANGIGVYARNITTIFEWLIISGVKLFEEIFYWISQGDETTDRSSDIESGEGIGEKLWQGVIIQANTFGEDKILEYYDDENILQATVTINCDGKQTIAKSFDQPFISHTIKRTSDDEVNWIVNNEVYIYDIEPESAKVWEGEFDVSNLTGLILGERTGFAYRSIDDATLILNFDDGTTQEYPLPNSNGDWHKEFFYLIAKKWKACKYRIETDGEIRVYKKHTEFWLKGYNSSQPFAPMQVMGGDSNITNIQI